MNLATRRMRTDNYQKMTGFVNPLLGFVMSSPAMMSISKGIDHGLQRKLLVSRDS